MLWFNAYSLLAQRINNTVGYIPKKKPKKQQHQCFPNKFIINFLLDWHMRIIRALNQSYSISVPMLMKWLWQLQNVCICLFDWLAGFGLYRWMHAFRMKVIEWMTTTDDDSGQMFTFSHCAWLNGMFFLRLSNIWVIKYSCLQKITGMRS